MMYTSVSVEHHSLGLKVVHRPFLCPFSIVAAEYPTSEWRLMGVGAILLIPQMPSCNFLETHATRAYEGVKMTVEAIRG